MRPDPLNAAVANALGLGPGDYWFALKRKKRIAGLKNLRPAGAYTPRPSSCAPAQPHLPKQLLNCVEKESGNTCAAFYVSRPGTKVAGKQSPTFFASN